MTEGYGDTFSGEFEFCNEDSIIIGGELFYVKIIFQISLRGSPVCCRGFTVFHLCRGNHRGRMYRGT